MSFLVTFCFMLLNVNLNKHIPIIRPIEEANIGNSIDTIPSVRFILFPWITYDNAIAVPPVVKEIK